METRKGLTNVFLFTQVFIFFQIAAKPLNYYFHEFHLIGDLGANNLCKFKVICLKNL